MSCWALVPLKIPEQGKTRLSSVLAPAIRRSLVIAMLERVVTALTESDLVDRIAIVGATSTLCPSGVLQLADPGKGLNAALSSASKELQSRGATELLVIHADLPCVSDAEINDIVRSGRRQGLALASDRHGRGTNALYLRTLSDFPFSFGPDSLPRHLAAAKTLGLQPALSNCPGLLLDIDTEEDLRLLGNRLLSFENYTSNSQRSLSHA